MATPLPKRTKANDKLISSTPFNKLTQRQIDYAHANNVPLYLGANGTGGRVQSPSQPPPGTVTPDGGVVTPNGEVVNPSTGQVTGNVSTGTVVPVAPSTAAPHQLFPSDAKLDGGGERYKSLPPGQHYAPGTVMPDGGVVYDGSGDPNVDGQRIVYPYTGLASNYQTGHSTPFYGQFPGTIDENGHLINGPDPVGGAGAGGGGATGSPSGASAVDPAKAAADLVKNNADRDALASIKNVLGQYGLDSLTDFAWQEIVSGRSGNEVLQDIRETPQFKQRFPAIEARQKAGLPPLSPGDYVSYENTATQYMRDAGLPKGFYDSPEDFTKFLTNDVSLKELGERVNLAKDAAYNAPTEVRSALRGQFGLGDGDLAAFFLDPNKAQPLLQRTYSAAQIAGAGTRTGYNINADQDYRLADLGVTAQQAQSGFNTLQQSQELFNPLTGHSNEGAITTDQQLGAAFGGNAADNQLVERRRSQRQADFADGGGFAANQQGLAGLGSASK